MNYRLKSGEIDIVTEKDGAVFVVEVRGTNRADYPPATMLHPEKIARVKRLAETVRGRTRKPVRMEFIEIVGPCWWPLAQKIRMLRID